MPKLTRREFLQRTAGAAVALELSRRLPAAPAVKAAELPDVVVSKGKNADSAATILKSALDGLGGISRFIKPGQSVAIKPNATWAYPPNTASSTDPDLLRALILMVREAGAKRVIVMDHCSIDPGTAECLKETGIGAVVDEMGVEKVFPDRYLSPREMFALVDFPAAKSFPQLGIIRAAVEADVRINMAVAKSHLVTKLTLCLKHMIGFMQLPGALHADLENGIAELNTASKTQAHLHILEAIRVRLPVGNRRQAGGDETDLTDPKRVKRFNEIVAGVDPVLIDAYGCITYFAFKPQELAHVKIAADMGLGEIDVDKASAAGKLAYIVAGQPTPTPSPSPSPTQTVTGTPQPTATPTATATGPAPTATPQPTATIAPTDPPPAPAPTETPAAPVVSPNSILNGALVPAAAIVLGAGVAARGRLGRADKDAQPDKPEATREQ
jgi:uncharacterized protein (DUF362 family)